MESQPPSSPAPAAAFAGGTRLTAFFLLTIFVALCITSVEQESATFDETHYLGSGRYLLTAHRWDMPDSLLHPVFWTVWHDLPLLGVSGPDSVWSNPNGIARGQGIMALRSDDALLTACRFMSLPFAIGLGVVMFCWARQLYGDAGGIAALFFFAFSPNLLAHAGLVTPDVALSCFVILTLWRLWALAKAPSIRNLLFAGGALGLMLLTKYTAVLLVPIFFVTDCAYRSAVGQFRWRTPSSFWRALNHWPALLALAALLVWVAYGFHVGRLALPAGLSLRLPAAPYFQGLLFQYAQSKSPHSFFLMGMYSPRGWWYYFLVVALIKIPVGTLLLLAGLVVGRRWLGIRWQADELYLLLPFVLMFAYLSGCNTIQNGFRYLLPVYPLSLIWLGNYGACLRRGNNGIRAGVGLLAAWTLAATLLAWPGYLAYFNELIGGPRNGYHWLSDSNVDWGQDLKALKKFMVRHDIGRIGLSYFGTADPAHYGIAYDYLPSANSGLRAALPSPDEHSRFLALSVYQYQAIDFADRDVYRFFYGQTPNGMAGNSILIFDLKNLTPRRRAPMPLRVREFFGLATNNAPADSCP